MKDMTGIFSALLTPFDNNYQINEDSLRKLVEFNLQNGIQGFYVGGSTGESMVMTAQERKQVFRCVADAVQGRVPIIAHVGSISTDAAIDMAKYAEALGYDAISAVAPFYYVFTFEANKQYYTDIVSSVNLPMIIYNFPNSGGMAFSAELAAQVFQDERFIGIKHTSADMFTLQQFKQMDREILVYNGFDEIMLSGLAMGADGAIGSTYNFMGDKFLQIKRDFDAGNLKAAQEGQNNANKIITQLIQYGVFQSEKAILTAMGIDMGPCRRPFLPITDEGRQVMTRLARQLMEEKKA